MNNSPSVRTVFEVSASERSVLADGLSRLLVRADDTLQQVGDKLPHWGSTKTGEWTLTDDGDWTGGSWPGQLWIAAHITGNSAFNAEAASAEKRMRPRLARRTAFKGYGFYYAAVLGWVLSADRDCRSDALECARDLASMFDPALGLIPLGPEAEEGSDVGAAESSIDSLQASPILWWAAQETGDTEFSRIAHSHTQRVLELHVREDNSVVQSTTLNPEDGSVVRHHTHKGYNDESTWTRAQSWAVLYSSWGYLIHPEEKLYLDYARKVTDWWLAHVPTDLVSYWDFDDPSIPDTPRDTAGTAIACSGMLKLAEALKRTGSDDGDRYWNAALETMLNITENYISARATDEGAPIGVLTEGCFTLREGSREHDNASNVELIFGTYFATECLAILTGQLLPSQLNTQL